MKPLYQICICLLLALTSLGASGAEPKRVLFIHSFSRGFEPCHTVAGTIRTELASQMDRTSLGLAGMRERVHLAGGELDIESAPGHGTTVLAWVPIQER